MKGGMGGGEIHANGTGEMNLKKERKKNNQQVVLKAKLKCVGLDVFQFKSINTG